MPRVAVRSSAFCWAALAPGRVNLIGEHTDYNGLPVLPMAIERHVRIEFVAVDDPVVRLDSALPRFDPFAFPLDRPIAASRQGHWSNYVRAAARGLLEHGVSLERGIAGRVSGDVPIASGLSSSSALVVASALALLKANEAALPRLELAALMARAERFVGLEGGGMDQAACLCGAAGRALRIDFEPLRVTPVAVPEGWRWVVASSLARAEKSGDAQEAYNERARDCRDAAARVVRAAGGTGARGTGARRTEALVTEARGTRAQGTGARYRALAGGSPADTEAVLQRAAAVLDKRLLRRFRHVVQEGRRVAEAERALRLGDMKRFGDLMLESHRSLRDDFEASTDALDEIVEVAMEAGAAGARLTGAGFGGCAVVLCEDVTVGPVMDALAARFHEPRLGRPPNCDEVFAVKAGAGARVEG